LYQEKSGNPCQHPFWREIQEPEKLVYGGKLQLAETQTLLSCHLTGLSAYSDFHRLVSASGICFTKLLFVLKLFSSHTPPPTVLFLIVLSCSPPG
jgi:hypothetical protein